MPKFWVICTNCRRDMLRDQDYPAFKCSGCGVKLSERAAAAMVQSNTARDDFYIVFKQPPPPPPKDETKRGGLSLVQDLPGAVSVPGS